MHAFLINASIPEYTIHYLSSCSCNISHIMAMFGGQITNTYNILYVTDVYLAISEQLRKYFRLSWEKKSPIQTKQNM